MTYQGKHLAFDGAYCDPKPIQQLPEIWIGGGGEKVTLRIEARHADKTNWQTGLEGFVRKSDLLEQYCDEIGRDFDSIVRTHGPDCRVFDTEADMQRWLDSPGGGSLWGRGDPRRVRARQLRRHRRAGRARRCRRSSTRAAASSCLWFRDFPSSESLEAFARDVVPQRHGSERVPALGFAAVTALSDAPVRPAGPCSRRGRGRHRAPASIAAVAVVGSPGSCSSSTRRSDLWLDEALIGQHRAAPARRSCTTR